MIDDTKMITLRAGPTKIEVWTIGARLNKASWDGFDDLLNGSDTLDEAIGPKLNHGCVVGPVANRIAGPSFEINGTTYNLPPNEGDTVICHCGDRSLRDRNWSILTASDVALVLEIEVGHMADGFPGNRRFEADYRVHDDGFDLRLSAETDMPTLVNLALHPYWTLNGSGRAGQHLKVAADRYLPINALKIPTGEIAPVDDTIFDLRETRTPDTGIDHNFCLSPRAADAPAVRVETDRRLALDILTDAPGVQIYTGKPFGIAIEPQHWPDTPHHPNFPPIHLDPGQTYEQTTLYRFSKT